MCELLAVAWPQPEPFSRVLPWACALERMGIAGFGWGVAWVENGQVRGYRDTGRLSEDPEAVPRLSDIYSQAYLVHLRRPSRLSTIDIADTQPFVQEAGEFAFCHNGLFMHDSQFRPRFAGSLQGRADSEVGFRLFGELLAQGYDPEPALVAVHRELAGTANLGYLGRDGDLAVYSGNPRNAVWSFRQEGAEVASTRLSSIDESLFDLIFREAEDRRLLDRTVIRLGGTGTLDRDLRKIGSAT